MCNWVWVVDEKRRLGNAKEFAEWLGTTPEELITHDDEPMPPNTPEYSWHNACLCPFDVDATLDRFRIFHRRDWDHDSMCTLALRKAE